MASQIRDDVVLMFQRLLGRDQMTSIHSLHWSLGIIDRIDFILAKIVDCEAGPPIPRQGQLLL